MKYPPNEALDSLDIGWVLDEEGIDYKETWGSSGRQLNLRECPFCGNRKHKVYLNADNALGNCFAGSCSQGTFNKWQLLCQIFDLKGRDMMVKIEDMARAQGWRPVTKETTKFDPGPLSLPLSYPVVDLPAMPKYLLDRGMDYELAEYFHLRWCEKGTFKVKDPKGNTIVQDYSKRVILPIYDIDGNLISFQGRDGTGMSDKRYLFPPMFSSTGSHFYNIDNWQEGMDSVVISEGPFDVIGVKRAFNQLGIKDTLPIGSFGMTLSVHNDASEDQLNKLLLLKEQGLRNITMLWDNEPVAIARAIDAGMRLRRYGFNVRVAVLQDAKDPGDASPKQIGDALARAYVLNSALQAMLLKRKLCQ